MLDVYMNEIVKKFTNDFVIAVINWIRPILLEEDGELLEQLETDPASKKTKNRLSTRLDILLERHNFSTKLSEFITNSQNADNRQDSIY